MPKKNLQKEKDQQTSQKTRAPNSDSALTCSTGPRSIKGQPLITFKKKKGRQRAQTSLTVFELDEKGVEYILGDDKSTVIQSLYEETREGKKLLFLATQEEVLKRLQSEIPYFVETEVLREQATREELQEEAMKIIQRHINEKIHADPSVYVGKLYGQDEMRYQPFSFGTVCTPAEYFSQSKKGSLRILPLKIEEQTSSRTSPVRIGEMELETKGLDYFDSRPESIKHNPFDDFESSQSSQKRYLFPIVGLQERRTEFYYSKIKDLNNLISGKLSSRFEQIKAKERCESERGSRTPEDTMSLTMCMTESEQKRRDDFEEQIFGTYIADMEPRTKFTNDIYDSSENVKDNNAIMTKIQNIRFEVMDDLDAQPIVKKLKGPDVKRPVQPAVDPSAKLNEIILEYKAGLPGERQIPIQIFGRDLQKLEPNCYINDTIIQFYLKLIQNEFLGTRKNSVYMYNTYLIEKLRSSAKKGLDVGDSSDFEKTYNSVKKWTKDVDIFEKDFLLFPAHDKNQKHWSLFVVCYPQYFLVKEESYNMTTEPTGSTLPKGKPFMLYFDSFRVMDTDTAKLIALYLEYEVMHKKAEIYNNIKQAFNSIREYRMYQLIVPLQDNYTDCGAYILEFAERFLMNPEEILENVENDRNKLNLFPRSIFKTKRNDIKNIILGLADGNKDVIKEYLENKKPRLEAAMKNPDNFTIINELEFRAYLRNKFDADISELDSRTRDRAKLGFLIQSHDQRIRTTSKN